MSGPDPIDLHVGKRILKRRRQLKQTQADLGQAMGVRHQQVQKYECAGNRISASRLYLAASALGVNVDYFFQGIEANHG